MREGVIATHAGYRALTGARHGAVGGAILGVPTALLLHVLTPPDKDGKRENALRDLAVSVGLAAADGALGAAVLKSARGAADAMDEGMSAAACATGSAVFAGAAIAAVALLFCVLAPFGRVTITRENPSGFEMA